MNQRSTGKKTEIFKGFTAPGMYIFVSSHKHILTNKYKCLPVEEFTSLHRKRINSDSYYYAIDNE